jgi:hypothetical protein
MPNEPSPMSAENDDTLDGLFHGCALAAFIDQAEQQLGWPDRELTRRRAFAYYEQALAAKNAAKMQAGEGAAPNGRCRQPCPPAGRFPLRPFAT